MSAQTFQMFSYKSQINMSLIFALESNDENDIKQSGDFKSSYRNLKGCIRRPYSILYCVRQNRLVIDLN